MSNDPPKRDEEPMQIEENSEVTKRITRRQDNRELVSTSRVTRRCLCENIPEDRQEPQAVLVTEGDLEI